MRTIEEYQDAIAIQLSFIKHSAHLFDQGEIDESLRIATAVSTLLIDMARRKSIVNHLLEKLKISNTMISVSLLSTGMSAPKLEVDEKKRNAIIVPIEELEKVEIEIKGKKFKPHVLNPIRSHSNEFMTLAVYDSDNKLSPILDKSRDIGFLSIADWLDQEICCFKILDNHQTLVLPMNRMNLIRIARDKDGGAHFDIDLESKKGYIVLKYGITQTLLAI